MKSTYRHGMTKFDDPFELQREISLLNDLDRGHCLCDARIEGQKTAINMQSVCRLFDLRLDGWHVEDDMREEAFIRIYAGLNDLLVDPSDTSPR